MATKVKRPGRAGKRGRSAITGRYVKQSTVRRHPDKTVNESTKSSGKKK